MNSPVVVIPSHPPTAFSSVAPRRRRVGEMDAAPLHVPTSPSCRLPLGPTGHVTLVPTGLPNPRCQPPADSPRCVMDVAEGATSAHLHPTVPSAPRPTGHVVTRCFSGPPPPTPALRTVLYSAIGSACWRDGCSLGYIYPSRDTTTVLLLRHLSLL